MVDFVALVTPPKLLGPTGKPANGDIYVRSTSNITLDGGIVTPFQEHGKIIDGEFKDLDGGPLMLAVTPEGVALDVYVEIVQDGPGGRRDKHRIVRTVSTPNQSTVTWDALVDVVPVDSSPDYEVPSWVTDLLTEAANAAGPAVAAKNEAVAARNQAVIAAASVPTEAELAATFATKAAVTPLQEAVEAIPTTVANEVKTTGRETFALRGEVIERVAFAGDSNTSYNSGLNNWTSILCSLSYGRAAKLAVWATGGYTIQQWRDTFLPQVLATSGRARPEALVLMLGTNNVNAAIPALMAEYESTVLDPLEDAGIRPRICTVAPREDSSTSKTWAQQWNAALIAMTSRRNLPLFDVYAALVDPATGGFKSGLGSGDGIHFFTHAGQVAVAKALRPAFLASLRGRVSARFAQVNNDATNANANALMLTGGGKFNGVNNVAGFASGWQSSAGLTIASGAPQLFTDAYGSWQRFKDIETTGNIQAQQLGIPVIGGHRYEVLMKYRPRGYGADAASYFCNSQFYAGNAARSIPPGYYASAWTHDLISASDDDYLVMRQEGVADADATTLRVTVVYSPGGATNVGKTLDYGQLSVVDLTAQGIV